MIPLWHPLRFLLVALAGWINQQQRDVIDYLQVENRVLREQLGPRRLRFTDDQRIRLAAKAKTLGRRALTEIILDLGLPDLDGVDLCRRLRNTDGTTPILTARDSVDSRIAGLDGGADDYLLKPFDLGELLARLRALVRRGVRPLLPESLRVGPLVLNTQSQQAFCHGTMLPLTTREYALLEFLVRHEGRVISRSDIAEHVWDNSYDPGSNVIDVYVRRLRAKLAPAGCEDVIQTRRGAGYLLCSDGTPSDGNG